MEIVHSVTLLAPQYQPLNFFFKEYAEWVYLARSHPDFSNTEYYQKYLAKCRILAAQLRG